MHRYNQACHDYIKQTFNLGEKWEPGPDMQPRCVYRHYLRCLEIVVVFSLPEHFSIVVRHLGQGEGAIHDGLDDTRYASYADAAVVLERINALLTADCTKREAASE